MSVLRRPALAVLTAATLVAAVSAFRPAPRALAATSVARLAVDPVGAYDWALDAQGQVFSGTLNITKPDTAYSATVTHMSGEEVKAKYVKLESDVMVIVSDTPYGDLTMSIKFADPIEAGWKVGDGSMGGPLKVVRKKKD